LLDIAALIITLFGPHWQHCKDINHSYDLCWPIAAWDMGRNMTVSVACRDV
jgi:hypothetical protein